MKALLQRTKILSSLRYVREIFFAIGDFFATSGHTAPFLPYSADVKSDEIKKVTKMISFLRKIKLNINNYLIALIVLGVVVIASHSRDQDRGFRF
jgi:hypothetical protein